MDGFPTIAEYGGAANAYIDHPYRPYASIVHDADNVYVCLTKLPRGSFGPTFAGVMFDLNHDRADPARADDYRFTVTFDGVKASQRGNGIGGFVNFSTVAGDWDVKVSSDEFEWFAEFRFRRTLLGIPEGWGPTLGFDVAHFWVNFQGDDYHWPTLGSWDLPSQWGNATFLNSGIASYTYSFPGRIVDQRGAGIPDARLSLLASNSGVSSTAATAVAGRTAATAWTTPARSRTRFSSRRPTRPAPTRLLRKPVPMGPR